MPSLGNCDTGFTRTAGIDRWPALPVWPDAIECLGNQPRGRCLADPTDARQQKRMGETVALDGIAQRGDHCILSDQLGKSLRTVFAGEDAVRLGCGHCFYP